MTPFQGCVKENSSAFYASKKLNIIEPKALKGRDIIGMGVAHSLYNIRSNKPCKGEIVFFLPPKRSGSG